MLISHLDERRTKTKGELLKRKNFVTQIHPTTNTKINNLRETASAQNQPKNLT